MFLDILSGPEENSQSPVNCLMMMICSRQRTGLPCFGFRRVRSHEAVEHRLNFQNQEKEKTMSGPIVRTGATPEFWNNWDNVFGKKSKSASRGTQSTATTGKEKQPATSKKAAPAKATAAKVTVAKATVAKTTVAPAKKAAGKKAPAKSTRKK